PGGGLGVERPSETISRNIARVMQTTAKGANIRARGLTRETAMISRSSIGAAALAAALCMSVAAMAEDAKTYPDWDGLWGRGSPVGAWDPAKPPGPRQEAPLTPEYQAVYQSNLAKSKTGTFFDIKATCGPVGMPRLMILYEPIEIVIKP